MQSTQHHPVGGASPKCSTFRVWHCGQDLDLVRGTHAPGAASPCMSGGSSSGPHEHQLVRGSVT